ncbi:hypothetical protein TcWFU_009438 [Taenia crassiceps]|uniref:Uncharacterized protein n=1 Tax=Taenia crassiceps TaxID=6207 RepID=A0ABR4QCF3_9CEST
MSAVGDPRGTGREILPIWGWACGSLGARPWAMQLLAGRGAQFLNFLGRDGRTGCRDRRLRLVCAVGTGRRGSRHSVALSSGRDDVEQYV